MLQRGTWQSPERKIISGEPLYFYFVARDIDGLPINHATATFIALLLRDDAPFELLDVQYVGAGRNQVRVVIDDVSKLYSVRVVLCPDSATSIVAVEALTAQIDNAAAIAACHSLSVRCVPVLYADSAATGAREAAHQRHSNLHDVCACVA